MVLHDRALTNGQLWDNGPVAAVTECCDGCARTQRLEVLIAMTVS